MNALDRALLVGIARQIAAILAEPAPQWYGTNPENYPRPVRRYRDAQRDVVRQDLAEFLQEPITDSLRVRANRALNRLEDAGLIERLSSVYATRAGYVRLMPTGRNAIATVNAAAS